MNKIIALNWKNTQTAESASALLKTVEDVVNIYPDYSWVIFPGDDFTGIIDTKIPLGIQNTESGAVLPYCLIGHMSQRLNGVTNENIQKQIESIVPFSVIPIFCVGPMREEDTLELVLKEQLVVLENWPKDKQIIIAYEPGFAI
jgi:triosephosphate isomerase